MIVFLQFLCGFYSLLLKFYPREYQKEYAEELQAVFNLSLDEAAAKGAIELEKLLLREFVSLPKAILYEHLRERRKARMTKNSASVFDFVPGSRTEIFAALTPFLFFGALPALLGYFHVWDLVALWLYMVFVTVLGLSGLSLLVIGFAKRFPRWFMPYIGLPLPIFSLLLFNSIIDSKWRGFPFLYRSSWFVQDFVFQGLLWIGLLFLVILLVVAARFIPKSRPFYRRLREDWTLLSFIIYGTIPLVLFIIFNEYKNGEPFLFLALLILSVGGWLYLRNNTSLEKYLYLHAGMSLSMLIVAAGKAVLMEQSFPAAIDATWQTEFMDTVITWLWLAIIMLIAPALDLLAWSRERLQTT